MGCPCVSGHKVNKLAATSPWWRFTASATGAGITVQTGSTVTDVYGHLHAKRCRVAGYDASSGRVMGGPMELDVDLVALSGGWTPTVHLSSHRNVKPVYRADLAICADMTRFAQSAAALPAPAEPSPAGAQAHAEWQAWNTPAPFETKVDLGQCVAAMRDALPADTIICNGAGNFSGWWHRYWHAAQRPSRLRAAGLRQVVQPQRDQVCDCRRHG